MRKLFSVVAVALLLASTSSLYSVKAHHGTNNYWHVHWETLSHPQNVSYEINKGDLSGGYYDVASSIQDWNSSQNKIRLVPWNSSLSVSPQMNIMIDRYPDSWWGNAGWSSPTYDATSDVHYIWATPRVNTRVIENAILNDPNVHENVRRKVVTHEIGHNLGLGHPTASISSVTAVMHQGWHGYSTVQPHDVSWINFRYDHIHSSSTTENNEFSQNRNSSGGSEIDWEIFDSISDLQNQSDVIISGVVLNSENVFLKDLPYTVHTIAIKKVIDGLIESAEIKVGQFGNKELVEVRDNPIFEVNSDRILFLTKVEHETYDYDVPYDYFVTGGSQGRFDIIDESIVNFSELEYLADFQLSNQSQLIEKLTHHNEEVQIEE